MFIIKNFDQLTIKPLIKGPNKGKLVGWTDIDIGTRVSI